MATVAPTLPPTLSLASAEPSAAPTAALHPLAPNDAVAAVAAFGWLGEARAAAPLPPLLAALLHCAWRAPPPAPATPDTVLLFIPCARRKDAELAAAGAFNTRRGLRCFLARRETFFSRSDMKLHFETTVNFDHGTLVVTLGVRASFDAYVVVSVAAATRVPPATPLADAVRARCGALRVGDAPPWAACELRPLVGPTEATRREWWSDDETDEDSDSPVLPAGEDDGGIWEDCHRHKDWQQNLEQPGWGEAAAAVGALAAADGFAGAVPAWARAVLGAALRYEEAAAVALALDPAAASEGSFPCYARSQAPPPPRAR